MAEQSRDNSFLLGRQSNFQPLRNKRPYENTDSYENHMRLNRIDPRTFSVFKILEEPKEPIPPPPPQVPTYYVQVGYVTSGYIEVLNQ